MKYASKLTKKDVVEEIKNWLKEHRVYMRDMDHDCEAEEAFNDYATFLLKKSLKFLSPKKK